jgi:hypothetical protein
MKDLFSRLFQATVKDPGCLLPLFFLLLAGCAHQLPAPSSSPPFNWNTDRFSFANETLWTQNPLRASTKEQSAYTRRCFVMSRAVLQFRKFARFRPDLASLPELELAKRVRQIASRSVWEPELSAEQRILFPGSKNLLDFSRKHQALLQKEIGAGWPTYFRPGNFALPLPVSQAHQQRTADELQQMIQNGQPTILWLTRFPSLAINHTVLVYAVRSRGSVLEFQVYDPNYTNTPKRLTYDKIQKKFSYQETFYFKGGPVTARTVYWSPLQ